MTKGSQVPPLSNKFMNFGTSIYDSLLKAYNVDKFLINICLKLFTI